MRPKRLPRVLVLLQLSAALQLPGQQTSPDRLVVGKIREKAERGDAQSQVELGYVIFQH
jgi:hypothetical protein